MAATYLHIGGLVAVGFDQSGSYLFTVSHAGRGVFSTRTWERLARDYERTYPQDGKALGIGPIAGQLIPVAELDSDHPIQLKSPDGRFTLSCESSGIAVTEKDNAYDRNEANL